ncbi:MAG: NmrA family NAD(P)-binding protein [Hyphomicrobiales bacterium]|nr:NmrA family NAD(P)-binding protein [Hyphomicrobiales bacterium]
MKKIAVFGANGNIGNHAVRAFCKAGWQVRAITRNGQFNHAQGIETASANAMDKAQVISATRGCGYIINCVNPPYPKWQDMCMPIAVNMITAAAQHKAVHLFPANVYNYGTQIPAKITNETPMRPDTKKGHIRLDMELLFEQFAVEKNVQTLILRAGDFFGGSHSQSSWFDTVVTKSLAKGKITYPGPMNVVHSWAYLPDMAQAFVKIAEQSNELSNFEPFLFKGHAITGNELKAAIEQVIEKSCKLSGLPWPLLRFAGLFSPMMREISEMSYLWHSPHQMGDRKLQQTIRNVEHTPLVQAVFQSLAESGVMTSAKLGTNAEGKLLQQVN